MVTSDEPSTMPVDPVRLSGRARGWWLAFFAAHTVAWGLALPARAGVTFAPLFAPDQGGFSPATQAQLSTHLAAAGAAWAEYLDAEVSLEVRFRVVNELPRAGGGSVTSTFRYFSQGLATYDQGAGAEIRTGLDPNGPTPDVEITFNTNYLLNELWFDPDPFARSALVPANRTDALSVVIHELGHALAINGWRDWSSGQLPGDYQSTFDEWVEVGDGYAYFTGPEAMDVYGGPVPLTVDNLYHFGNFAPEPGSDLVDDLMNGVVFYRGSRYYVSPLNVAVLADVGLPIIDPTYLLGDANGDCTVGAADYAIWAAQFGQTAPGLAADFDGNGSVGAGDYTLWAANFGQTCGPSGVAASVPEPASGVLLAVAGLLVVVGRGRIASRFAGSLG